MSHRFTDPADERHEEPEQDLAPPEWDRDEEPGALRILWGRLVVLALLLGGTFLLGRATAPGGAPEAELARARAELRTAQETIERLEAAAAEEPEAEPSPTRSPTPSPSPEAAGGDVAAEPPEGETYVVKPGDNLQLIADRFYDDPALADVIAEANDIEDPSHIAPGTELVIPEDPEP